MHAIAGVDTKHRMNARIFMNAPLLPMVAVYQKSSVGITKISVDLACGLHQPHGWRRVQPAWRIPKGPRTTNAVMASARILLALLPAVEGCATTSTSPDVEQVQEVSPGTYKIGIAHTVRMGHDMENEAVSKAGQYCHAKGQKLIIVP